MEQDLNLLHRAAQVLQGLWKCIRRVRALALWLRLLSDGLSSPLSLGMGQKNRSGPNMDGFIYK